MNTSGCAQTKQELRAHIRKKRRAQEPSKLAAALTEAGHALIAHLGIEPDSIVGAFLPSANEPPLTPFLEDLATAHTVYVPVAAANSTLQWSRWTPQTPTQQGRHASIPEPQGPTYDSQVLTDAALVFVPALALDDHGRRLGQGGGYYDRFLAQLPRYREKRHHPASNSGLGDLQVRPTGLTDRSDIAPAGPLRCAVIFADEFWAQWPVPCEPWDEPVDYALWPGDFRKLAPRSVGYY